MSPSSIDESVPFCPVSELAARSVTWLWPNRLAGGKLAILDGDPGLGKSLVALDLCARLSTGRAWPDGSATPGPACSIVLNGEDGPEDTIRTRLQFLGADLGRVFVPRLGEAGSALLRFPQQTDVLRAAVVKYSAKLVVIDPIMAFLDNSVMIASNQRVRAALLPLIQLAEERECVVLLIRHLNKLLGRHALYRGGGSIGIVGACRSAWLVGVDPKQPKRRVLAQVKNNLAGPQPSLGYEILPRDNAPPELTWHGPSPWLADQIIGVRLTKHARACMFLAVFLEKGPRTSREVWNAGREQGLAERTLRRAKRELGVTSQRVYADGANLSYWLLPGQKLPEGVTGADDENSLEQWLAPLREKYPVATPLDEE